jgi:NAD+ kinase
MPPLRQLAFVINTRKSGAPELAAELMAQARATGATVRETSDFPLPPGFLHGCDACCVIGGDGTLLGVAPAAVQAGVPLIGVNRGNLGFLTTFSAEEARHQFGRLMGGAFKIAYRSLLECSTGPGQSGLALNDVLIKDERHSPLVRLDVYAGDEYVTRYTCDGLIFSTPTGSTAYTLSAGGPLVHPDAEVIALTPICPHTLSNRSIIFRQNVCLKVHNRSEAGSRLRVALDGQHNVVTAQDDSPITITMAKRQLALVQRADYSHFAVLRTKLMWSGGVIGHEA